jgi:hypothetical protein
VSRRRSCLRAAAAIALLVGPVTVRAADGADPGGRPGSILDRSVDIRGRKTADLYAACLAEQGAPSGWCSAYLIGVADTLAAFGDGGNTGGICKADYVIDQLPEIFLTWVRSNPPLRNIDMLAGASLAFRTTWPCR